MGRVRAAVLAVWLILVLAIPAEAQGGVEYTLDLQVTPIDAPIRPITDNAVAPFDVTVVCGLAEHDFLEHSTMTFTAVSDAPWATVVVAPPTWVVEYHMEDCIAGVPREMNGTIIVGLTKDAPAGGQIPLRFTAQLEEFEQATIHWNETVAPYMRTQVRFDTAVWKVAPGGTAEIPTTVENIGNGPVKVTMSTYGNTSEELLVNIPPPIEVAANEKTTFALEIKAPGTVIYTNERHMVNVEFMATSLVDQTITEGPHRVSAVVQVQGSVADEAPAPVLPFVLALGLLALVARRHLVQQ